MFTPQQIDQVSFKQSLRGYDMEQVDAFLEPLTEDYVTLYENNAILKKENAVLKSKMVALISKLKEYRSNETAMKEAVVNAQKTCDRMVREAEAKCTQMLSSASAAAAESAQSAETQIAAEDARVEEARRIAAAKISDLQEQLHSCIQALERLKSANAPQDTAAQPAPASDSDAVANEIAQNLEALVGTTEETAPKAAPQHPTADSTTSRFANLDLQFGN